MEKLPILYEDKHLMLVNKPAGIAVERDRYRNPSVEGRIGDYFNAQKLPHNTIIGIAHRLDRPVSGVMLVAKKKSVLVQINQQFEAGLIKKIYFAITENKPEKLKATLNHFLFKDVKNKKAVVYDKIAKSRLPCSLDYIYKGENAFGHLIEVHPHTGKFHQIRAQLAFIGCPIIGDTKYGAKKAFAENEIGLHAFSLQFFHPVEQKEMIIQAPLLPTWEVNTAL
ncbi:MAG: RluA family pseudouridine synthase [Bacteroidetes bacterium]|nr:RluA family pseudouridine synthase [Bacteroidota bacterium]